MSALAGTLVLDLTRLLPGAVATKQLVDWGAEVIKIEQPGEGDYARRMAPAVFARTNGGKKSIVIDLKKRQGRDVLLSLARRADVLVEGNRPGVMARLGLGYEDVRAVNERLIYASLTGYGQTGPYAQMAGHDLNYISLGGVMGLNLPVIPGVQIADLVGGSIQTVTGILLALVERERSGKGRHVDISMYAGVTALLTVPLAMWQETEEEPEPGSLRLNGHYACYNIYECSDGRWIAVGALEPKFWAELCRRLERPDLIARQYEKPQDELKSAVAAIFRTRPAFDWFEQLRDSDCCVTPVLKISEVARELAEAPGPPPPGLGQHTREVLSGHGVSPAEIADLTAQGVIA
jgi:crotonobetainyl-CoA:carnitine CoA-transferase CaiB-like acyl-CoA transferase